MIYLNGIDRAAISCQLISPLTSPMLLSTVHPTSQWSTRDSYRLLVPVLNPTGVNLRFNGASVLKIAVPESAERSWKLSRRFVEPAPRVCVVKNLANLCPSMHSTVRRTEA